ANGRERHPYHRARDPGREIDRHRRRRPRSLHRAAGRTGRRRRREERRRIGGRMARRLVVAVALLVVSCSGSTGPEQQVLSNFFRAARTRDNVTLGNLSAVSFDTRTDGAVQDFTITTIGEEQRRTLPIHELTEAINKAKADDEELAQRKKVYQDANMPALQRVVKAEQAK